MLNWMIYGANGFTGKLIAQEAAAQGLKPILAGRNESVTALAAELGLEARRFDLSSPSEIARNLSGVSLVLHCAGPFSATSRPMLDGCIAVKAHYLDITGEVAVFESIFERDAELKRAGILAMPGVGFDVVPTDCLAKLLKEKLPDANRLRLAWKGGASISPGTAKSMIEGMREGAVVRKDGKLVKLPMGSKSIQVPFRSAPETAMLIAWGDVSTAFRTTGIPDIEIYTAGSPTLAFGMRVAGVVARAGIVQGWMKALATRYVKGPDEKTRDHGKVYIWGEARNAGGKTITQNLVTPEGYKFTVHSSLLIVKRLLQGVPHSGALTPGGVFGVGILQEIPGVELT